MEVIHRKGISITLAVEPDIPQEKRIYDFRVTFQVSIEIENKTVVQRIVNQVNNLRDELKELGLMPETTYLYMQGHHVMDNVVMKLLIPVCTALRREREQEIKRLAEHNEQFRNELTCYQNSQVNVEIMLKKNVAYKRLFHYEWLRQDIQEYLAKGE